MTEPQTVSVLVNGVREIRVPAGRSLFAALRVEKIFLASACGGRGACGLCKCNLLDDAGPLSPAELALLTGEERRAGVRLSCRVKPARPLRIEVPEAAFQVKEFQATVVKVRNLTYDIREIILNLAAPKTIVFKAGQFIQVRIPPYAAIKLACFRQYSIASPPASRSTLGLQVRRVPNGVGTTYLFDHLARGDAVLFNGPYGDFTLRKSARNILFVAGGSGMAPIKSMLEDMREQGTSRRARYFFGARTRRDLFCLEDMEALERELPDFKFIPALSAPTPADAWTGETGLVTAVLDRQVTDLADTEAYLCGGPAMIDACVAVLARKGMPRERIFYDKFG